MDTHGSHEAAADAPASVTRAVRLVWLLVLLGVVMTVLAVVLDDQILRAYGVGVSADDTRVPPSFTPVVIVLDITVTCLVLVLLAFLRGAHNWARHCLAAAFVLLGVAMAAMLRAGPPLTFVPPAVGFLLLVAALLFFLYRPETSAFVARPVVVDVPSTRS